MARKQEYADMNREEEQYQTDRPISQSEQPTTLGQVIALVVFFTFIIGLPTIIKKVK